MIGALVALLLGAVVPTNVAARAATPALTALDYEEIRQLYARYAFALDLGDGARRAATFTPDGTFSSALSNHVPEPMEAVARRTTARGNIGMRHLMLNIAITPTPEGADARCYALILPHAKPTAATVPGTPGGTVYGTPGIYIDKLVRTADGWRFSKREIWLDNEPDSPFGPKPQAQARP
jgi:hypothetical protein